MIDLHIHSTASDGTDTPETIITKCSKLGLKLTAITDHDTVDAQPEAIRWSFLYAIRESCISSATGSIPRTRSLWL